MLLKLQRMKRQRSEEKKCLFETRTYNAAESFHDEIQRCSSYCNNTPIPHPLLPSIQAALTSDEAIVR